jgi:hypothetical protein
MFRNLDVAFESAPAAEGVCLNAPQEVEISLIYFVGARTPTVFLTVWQLVLHSNYQ